MMIVTNSQYPGYPVADISQFAGLFGSLPAGDMPECADASTALIGWEKVTPSTKNHPNAGMQYG
ncbi:hypothetical protein NI484_004965, partial [Salmonella enterica]|nr:hypothetical protein [Salmonella enterica]